MTPSRYTLFVACAPGIEPALVQELADLEFASAQVPGGANLVTDQVGMYRLLLGCGLGLRVLLRLPAFPALRFSQLERGIGELALADFLPRDVAVAIKVTTKKSRLYHSGAVAERVAAALQRSVGARAAVEGDQALNVHARMERDQCQLSIDLCGTPLQHRGYRLQTAKAPLREDLARALLRLAGFGPGVALLDPMCGSGTLPIEAALLGRGQAPGLLRPFALQRLPFHDAAAESEARARLVARASEEALVPLLGSDRDAGAVSAAVSNAQRAGIADLIQWQKAAVSTVQVPAPGPGGGLIVCNPPYGHRIGKVAALRDLYAALGRLRESAPPGYRLALLTSRDDLAQATGIRLRSLLMTDLGGLKVKFFVEQ